MGLWGLLVKSVEVSGETNDTFVSLLKKWNEIFQRSEIFEQIQSVEKPKDNPSTVDEACTTLVAPTFTLKFWNDTYCDLDEWACHSSRYKCDFSSWDEAYYQIHIAYSANGKTLGLDYLRGEDCDGDINTAALRLSLAADDGSINTSASAEAETEYSDGVYPPDMFKEMEKPKTGERFRAFVKNLTTAETRIKTRTRWAEWQAEKEKEAEAEHKQKLDDAFGDL